MSEIVWMPHAAHFIGAWNCRFHLATYVNGHIVSTVGDYFPPSLGGVEQEREHIGLGRFYETMVFRAKPRPADLPPCGCPFVQEDGDSLDFEGYLDADEAVAGHMRMLAKWTALAGDIPEGL